MSIQALRAMQRNVPLPTAHVFTKTSKIALLVAFCVTGASVLVYIICLSIHNHKSKREARRQELLEVRAARNLKKHDSEFSFFKCNLESAKYEREPIELSQSETFISPLPKTYQSKFNVPKDGRVTFRAPSPSRSATVNTPPTRETRTRFPVISRAYDPTSPPRMHRWTSYPSQPIVDRQANKEKEDINFHNAFWVYPPLNRSSSPSAEELIKRNFQLSSQLSPTPTPLWPAPPRPLRSLVLPSLPRPIRSNSDPTIYYPRHSFIIPAEPTPMSPMSPNPPIPDSTTKSSDPTESVLEFYQPVEEEPKPEKRDCPLKEMTPEERVSRLEKWLDDGPSTHSESDESELEIRCRGLEDDVSEYSERIERDPVFG